jgi:hypothetical protein
MRDVSKPLRVHWTPAMLERIGRAPEHGACACGRLIVSRYGYKEEGRDRHARRRCTNRKAHKVTSGAKW